MTHVNLLFGFLGSGKTTLAKHLLDHGDPGERRAVIVNEFGEVGIDGAILRGRDVDVVEITSGCLCCTLKGSLVLAIQELREKSKVDRILVEATGIALPGDLLETLAIAGRRQALDIGPLVTVVDAARFDLLLARLGPFYRDQVENADIVLVNKADLVDADACFAVASQVRRLNPAAQVMFARHGRVEPARLFSRWGSGVLGRAVAREGDHGPAGEADPHRAHGHDHDHDHEAGDPGSRHAHLADTFVLEPPAGLSRAGVEGFFGALADTVWRAKGFVRLEGAPCLVQYTLGQLEITPAAAPSRESLVFIGQRMDRAGIAARFASLGAA